MGAEEKDLTILNHDQQLAADLKAGKVSAEEVARIWELTSDLSAQAPINVRRAMIAIRAAETPEQKVHLAMQFMMSAATEIQAAMTRDESKFAHLVAGTESIVKALQNVNPLARRLERLESLVDGLGELMKRKFAEIRPPVQLSHAQWQAIDQFFKIPKKKRADQSGMSGDKAIQNEEAIPDPDAEPNAARAESIGSAWAPPPDQGPLYLYECPNEECGYAYLSGISAEKMATSFRCLIHNLELRYTGEAQPEHRANFARQILKHT